MPPANQAGGPRAWLAHMSMLFVSGAWLAVAALSLLPGSAENTTVTAAFILLIVACLIASGCHVVACRYCTGPARFPGILRFYHRRILAIGLMAAAITIAYGLTIARLWISGNPGLYATAGMVFMGLVFAALALLTHTHDRLRRHCADCIVTYVRRNGEAV